MTTKSTKQKNQKVTTLGERIASMMEKRNMSQGELGRAVGMAQQSVNYLLKPRTGAEAKSDRVVEIAIALGADPVWLATGRGMPTELWAQRAPIITLGTVATYLSTTNDQRRQLQLGLLDDVASCDTKLSPPSFALRALDRANAPSINPGSLIFFDPEKKPIAGNLVVAAIGSSDREMVIRTYFPRSVTSKGLVFELKPGNEQHVSYMSDQVKIEIIATGVEVHTYMTEA